MNTKSIIAADRFVPGSSRGPRNARTLALQMAMEQERQHEVAERIRRLRGPKPQPVIADEVGVGLRAYQHWEAGGGISWENLQKLAEVLGVTENYLLYGEGEPVGPETQLDRIERALEKILSRLPGPAEEFERELSQAAQQAQKTSADTGTSARSARRPGKAR